MAANDRWETFVQQSVATHATIAGWAKLADVRADLDARGTSRKAQDEQLKRMSGEGKIALAPISARMLLTDADHAAAIRIGGDDSHQILWGPKTR